MSQKSLESILKSVLGDALLEVRSLGKKSHTPVVWVERAKWVEVSRKLYDHEELKFEALENLTAWEVNRSLYLDFFLRKKNNFNMVVFRIAFTLDHPEETVAFFSSKEIWKNAAGFERETSELFGIEFEPGQLTSRQFLPEGWVGFPLRKDYVFPVEYHGVSHLRGKGKSLADEWS